MRPTPSSNDDSKAPLLQALESALVENPDDLASHSAYADYLSEHDDPRGEFIGVQLALEDPSRSAEERKRLKEREGELLHQHARQWLGDLGRFLVGDWSGPDKPYHFAFRRGWLDTLRVLPAPEAILASLARAPEARLLRRLEVVYDMRYHPFEFDPFMEGPNKALIESEEPNEIYEEADIMPPLLESPYLSNLRVFKLGYSDSEDRLAHSTMVSPFGTCTAQQVIELLGKNPHLDELYLNAELPGVEDLFALPTLGNIRVLQYYYATNYVRSRSVVAYPLTALANNPSLQRLTTLRFVPGRDASVEVEELSALLRSPNLPSLAHLQVAMTAIGDEGVRRIVESGVLKRLKSLDINYGTVTDAGARLLAASPDLRYLDVLNVSRNALTPDGIAALRASGVSLIAHDQHDPDEEFYFEVDME